MAEKKKTKELSFEDNMQRLEAIVESMESSDLPLETLIEHYEEGVKLVKVCSEKLNDVERRIQIITNKASGETVLETFDPEAKTEPPPSKSSQPATEKNDDQVSLF